MFWATGTKATRQPDRRVYTDTHAVLQRFYSKS